jgi:hypothetical protein
MKLRVEEIRKVAMKYPGMFQAFRMAGVLSDDRQTIEITREAFDELNAHYFKGAKLGTRLHELLRPIATIADALLGTELADCDGCAEREMKLNSAVEPER